MSVPTLFLNKLAGSMGDADFVTRAGRRFGRQWSRGHPENKAIPAGLADDAQCSLFID